MNLLSDPILSLSSGERLSLPALLAAMTRGEVRGFAALRPHQRPAWHMFLVQLGALALWTAGRGGAPEDDAAWASALRGLTPDHRDDAPWRLAVADESKPAFLQPPAPEGLHWSETATPDALDMLITARNHDVKQAVARRSTPEDWVYALVSLQTCEGFSGRGHYGIARMNGGSSSRPLVGLAPARAEDDVSIDPSAWWARDVKLLLAAREKEGGSCVGVPGGQALLWCLEWPEGEQLDLRGLDPWFIEICRRVRLSNESGRLSARRATSKGARIDARAFKGNTGDPWAPVHCEDGKSLTLGEGGRFHYRRLCDLLFSGNWRLPLLASHGDDESGDALLVAEAFARGNCKTGGFQSRVVPVPGRLARSFSADEVETLAEMQIEEIRNFDAALEFALALAAAGAPGDVIDRQRYRYALPACNRFDRAADRLFFASLWRRVDAASENAEAAYEAKRAFLDGLREAAEAELSTALLAISCPAISRPRAEARARRVFRNQIWKFYPELFDRETTDARPHEDGPAARTARDAANWLQGLPSGPLAELRRTTAMAPPPTFQRLVARHPGTLGGDRHRDWVAIVRVLAILTEMRDPAGRSPLHDPDRPFGAILCDGGDRTWPYRAGGIPRPMFSERRLAQLLAARGSQRAALLERAARALARRRDPGTGVDVVDIADTLLGTDAERRLAEPYYRRLDRARACRPQH